MPDREQNEPIDPSEAPATRRGPIHDGRLQDEAYARLREGMIAGQFPPGRTFAMRALAEEFGMSIMPVRDALKRTWGRETRLDMANKGAKQVTTPQLTGKYAPARG